MDYVFMLQVGQLITHKIRSLLYATHTSLFRRSKGLMGTIQENLLWLVGKVLNNIPKKKKKNSQITKIEMNKFNNIKS